jgi:ribonuclease D
MIIARDSEAIASLVQQVRAAEVVAFDTEFLWEKTYRPILCLVQVAVDGVEAIADPLATNVKPLWEAIADAPRVLVHAGAHDLDLMFTAVGRLPATVFDTQIAGAFLGYGDSAGYSSLVEATLRRKVKGGEGYTDWSRRPLSTAQLEYAVEDVRHLHDLKVALAADLDRRGRSDWAAEETVLRFEGIGDEVDPTEMWRRVKGSNRLRGKALAVLREVAAWRESEAMSKDESRRRVVSDEVLIEVARRAPTDEGQIAAQRGLHPGQAKRVAGPLLAAVRRASAVPERDWPRWDQKPAFAGDPTIEPIASVLHGILRMRARDLDISGGLLATRGDLEELVRRRLAGELDQAPPRILSGWRKSVIGDDLLHVLDGQASIRIRVDGDGPALEIG